MPRTPLAESLRPQKLADFFGQSAACGPDGIIPKLLRANAEMGFFPSLIFWGPPGCGKTTLARIIANELKRPFYEFSAVNTSIKDIEKVITPGKVNQLDLLIEASAPLVFIDEIHRFNKSQQDALLPHVERGDVTLLGATTENPSFSVIGPLLSRCRVVVLQQLDESAMEQIVVRAISLIEKPLQDGAISFLLRSANGDARVALNVLEIACNIALEPEIAVSDLEAALQKRQLTFDKGGEEFYNTISALHKSMRGSDADASLYWLARMLEAGQDPLYIARRLVRFSSEDIGLANAQALILANAAYQACSNIGIPECNVILAELVVYLAKSPKSNALYLGYGQAAKDANEHGNLPVPMHIRNAETKLMKAVGYGKGYDYSHSAEGKKKEGVVYFPEELKDRKYL